MKYFKMSMLETSRWAWGIDIEWHKVGEWIGPQWVGNDAPDGWAYTRCERLPSDHPEQIGLWGTVYRKGQPVDFRTTGTCNVPIASQRFAKTIEEIAPNDLQRIPFRIEGAEGEWEILNVLPLIDCLDRERSWITYFPENEPLCPSRSGKPRRVINLTIHADRTSGHQIFRIKDWQVVIAVSEQIKDAIERAELTGMKFESVMPDDPTRVLVPRPKRRAE